MKFIAIKTDDGTIKGKLAFYCRMLHVSRQGFYKYLSVKDRPWKYQTLQRHLWTCTYVPGINS